VNAQIHRARPGEWREVRDLRLRALEDAPDAFGSTLEREREADEARWVEWITGWEGAVNALFAAVADGTWIAMAVGSRTGKETVAHLYGMWVEPRARRAGLGARLVEAVLGWARSWSARSVELNVTESNPEARSLYRACGFVETGERRPLREGSALVVVVMRYPLEDR
jgi:GNAT superfamily N-acetyltransferase